MRTTQNFIALLVFFLGAAAISASDDEEGSIERVSGKLDAVTVYPDRALVRRIHRIDKRAGVVRFVNIPQSVMSDTIAASGKGLTISGVSLKTVVKVETEFENHPVKLEMTKLDRELKMIEDKVSNLRDQLKLLNSFGHLTTAQTDRESRANTMRIDTWKEALIFIEDKRENYQNRIRQHEVKLDELQKERKKLTIKFNQLTREKNHSGIEVDVSFSAGDGNRSEIFLEYMVGSVSWTGIYDLHGSSEGNDFQWSTFAVIRQSTGEAWKNALITLSTARPATGMSPGQLVPWRLSGSTLTAFDASNQDNERNRKEKTKREGATATEASADSAPGLDDASDTTTFSIPLKKRETIASDGSDQKVALGTTEIKGTLSHVAVPSVSNFVYLKARLRNQTAMPILWNQVNVFLDGNFIGVSQLTQRAAVGEELDIFLGADQRMQLKRTLIRGDVENSGVFTKKVDVLNQWQIEVSNFTKKARQIQVFDQYPIPGDPNISTKLIGSSRSDYKADPNGILLWKIDVKNGETIKFDFTYSLSIPRETWNQFTQIKTVDESAGFSEQYYNAAPAKPAAPQRQYNLEKMLQKR